MGEVDLQTQAASDGQAEPEVAPIAVDEETGIEETVIEQTASEGERVIEERDIENTDIEKTGEVAKSGVDVAMDAEPPKSDRADCELAKSEVEVQRAWSGSTIESLLQGEAPELLDWLDPLQAWGRPLAAEAVDVEEVESAAALQAADSDALPLPPLPPPRWRAGELLRRVRLTIARGGRAAGFGEAAVVRREPEVESRACRICMEDDGPGFDLLTNVCACRGSLRFLCTSCLLKAWEARGEDNKADLSCRVCYQPFVGRAQELLSKQLRADVREQEAAKPQPSSEEEINRCKQKIAVATKLWQQCSYTEAALLFGECIAKLSGIPCGRNFELTARHNLALVLHAQGQHEGALIHAKAAHEAFGATFGAEHALTLKAAHNEAMICADAGQKPQARACYEATLGIRRRVLGAEHVDTLKTSVNLGQLLVSLGEAEKGEQLLRETMLSMERVLGRHHPLALLTLQNLSIAISARATQEGKPVPFEAVELAREALEGRQRTIGDDNVETLEGRRDLGNVLAASGKIEEAEENLRQALAGMERVLGFSHPKTKEVLSRLRSLLETHGDADRARLLLEEHGQSQAVSGAKEVVAPRPERGVIVLVILSLFVAADDRRCGLARAAVAHWKALAQELRAQCVEVEVPEEALDALAFFAACGFKEAKVAAATPPVCPVRRRRLCIELG